ncbi:hypothetical protein DITRI_Ditri19aG0000800 [Diplodiscus trichospermus]
MTQFSTNGPLAHLHEMPEALLDPRKELAIMIAERKYDEAFTAALHRSDVSIVSWLCSQVDLQWILSMKPCPLSQGVLLALFQQLACDINKETSRKLAWMTDVAVAINPSDPMIAVLVIPIFSQVSEIVDHLQSLSSTSASESASIRFLRLTARLIGSALQTNVYFGSAGGRQQAAPLTDATPAQLHACCLVSTFHSKSLNIYVDSFLLEIGMDVVCSLSLWLHG